MGGEEDVVYDDMMTFEKQKWGLRVEVLKDPRISVELGLTSKREESKTVKFTINI